MSKQTIDLEIKNINDEIERKTTIHEKFAIWFSSKIGSMSFIYSLILFVISWVSVNIALFVYGSTPFDKPYEFSVLLLISNTVQLLTPLFILVSQNIQSRREKALADQQYAIAKRTENETKLIFEYLQDLSDKQQTVLSKINLQQQKTISLEQKQSEINDLFSKNLMALLKVAMAQIHSRPCLLDETAQNKDLCDVITKALKKYQEKIEESIEKEPVL